MTPSTTEPSGRNTPRSIRSMTPGRTSAGNRTSPTNPITSGTDDDAKTFFPWSQWCAAEFPGFQVILLSAAMLSEDGPRESAPTQATSEVIVFDLLRGVWQGNGVRLLDALLSGRTRAGHATPGTAITLSLIHISEPTRLGMISYAVFCLK